MTRRIRRPAAGAHQPRDGLSGRLLGENQSFPGLSNDTDTCRAPLPTFPIPFALDYDRSNACLDARNAAPTNEWASDDVTARRRTRQRQRSLAARTLAAFLAIRVFIDLSIFFVMLSHFLYSFSAFWLR